MKRIQLGFLAFGLLLASPVQAQKFEISPFFGYRFGGQFADPDTGDLFNLKDGQAYGIFIGFGPQDSETKLELSWSRQESGIDLDGLGGLDNVDMTIDQYQLGATAETGSKYFREYLAGSIGVTHFSTDGYGSDTRFSLGMGAGAKYFPFRNVALRVDVRGFCTIVDGEAGFISSGGGTIVVFSGTSLWQAQISAGVSILF